MGEPSSTHELRARLERGEANPIDAVGALGRAAIEAATRAERLDACNLLGDLAGRAHGAEWDAAERAAFALLEAARIADTAADRRGVIAAMGRGFRNIWLLPFIHRRLTDKDATIAAAALDAAGGLGFPALEEAVAAFIAEGAPAVLRRAAIGALGRMGATSAVDRLVPLIAGDPGEAAAALSALTEIRSGAGRDAALALVETTELEPELQIAAVRYLAELGALEVLPVLRRLARSADAEIRIAASLASRSLKAERDRDAAERFLIALSEPDRAVRAVLARRLRTLAVKDVLEQADVLLADDAAGVVQVLAEVRENEVTRYFLSLAARTELPVAVRARAVGSIEANTTWERDELAKLAHGAVDDSLRASAIQAMGAFALSTELLDRVADLASSPSPALRGAVLWALQLARRPGDRSDAVAIARVVEPLLDDPDALVRRRATYVAGNLGLDRLAPALARRLTVTGDESDEHRPGSSGQFSSAAIAVPASELRGQTRAAGNPADLRLAAYVALGELGMPGVVDAVVTALKREDDPRVLGAASNALIASSPDAKALSPLTGRVAHLLASPDARLRHAGAELAGLLGGAIPPASLVPLASDASPAVRGAAMWALGRLADPSTERTLLAAFDDDDATVHERAATGLLRLGTAPALAQAIRFVAGDGDETARGTLAAAIHVPPAHAEQVAPVIDEVLAKTGADDPAFDALVRIKLATHVARGGTSAAAVDVDAEIAGMFPSYAQLTKLAGFDALVKSLRTAESLFHTTGSDQNADLSPPITLWMKVLENYVHAWLGPRMATLQREPSTLFDYVDRVIGGSWSGFARWIEPRWKDPFEVGGARVDIPLRSVPNAVRELQERKRKRLDSPLSVTEWARLMVLFAVDHPSTGFKNLFKLSGKSSERTVTLAHRLHALAAVRNLVTHRASAGAATLGAFRRAYYSAFEDLVALA